VSSFHRSLLLIDGVGSLPLQNQQSTSSHSFLNFQIPGKDADLEKAFVTYTRQLQTLDQKEGTTKLFLQQIQFLAYAATIVASLPYEDDEPLRLCSEIQRHVAKHGEELKDQIMKTLWGVQHVSGESIQGAIEDLQGEPPDKDLAEWLQELTLQLQAAMALSVLIGLQTNLIGNYSLSDKKYEESLAVRIRGAKPLKIPKVSNSVLLDFSSFPPLEGDPAVAHARERKRNKSIIPDHLRQQVDFFLTLMEDSGDFVAARMPVKRRPTKAARKEAKKDAKKDTKAKGKGRKAPTRKRKKAPSESDSEDDAPVRASKTAPPSRKALKRKTNRKTKKYKDHMSSEEEASASSDEDAPLIG
jgi:hypothetical protein